jgi:hypothetical protein
MNKYIMINHGVGSASHWDEYFKMLHDDGHIIGGSALDHGISLKSDNFTDPISKTITGYIVIQADDIDVAKRIMLESPIIKAGGTVELFTLV